MNKKRAGDLKPGDRYAWYGRWRTVTDIQPTDRSRFNDRRGNGVYVSDGSGFPTKLWVDELVLYEPAATKHPEPGKT